MFYLRSVATVPASADESVAHEQAARLRVLVAAGLIEDDPESASSIVFPLPAGASIESIIGGYNTRETLRRKIRCAACPQHQAHYRGFRVQLADGRSANIGLDCGERHFGEGAWRAALSEYDRRVEAANYEARVAPALSMIEQIMPLIVAWHERSKMLVKQFSELRIRFPELHRGIVDAAKRSEGRLQIEERVRREEVNKDGFSGYKVRIKVTQIGRIPFSEFFLGSSPNSSLVGAKHELATVAALLSNKRDTVSTAKAFGHLQRARQHLTDAAGLHDKTLLNLEPGWLQGLCKWANLLPHLRGGWGDYRAEGRTILRTETEATFDWPSPDSLGSSPLGAIEALWRASEQLNLKAGEA